MSKRRKPQGTRAGWCFFWLPLFLACAPARPIEESRPEKDTRPPTKSKSLPPEDKRPAATESASSKAPQPNQSSEGKTPDEGPRSEPKQEEVSAAQAAGSFCSGAALNKALGSANASSSKGIARLEPAPRPNTGFKDASLGPAYFGARDLDFDSVDDSIFVLRQGEQARFFFFSRKKQCDEFLFSLEGLQVEGRQRRGRLELRVFLGANSPGGLRHFTYDPAKGLEERAKVSGPSE